MEEFMRAVAQTFRNMGVADVSAGHDFVRVNGMEFYASWSHRGFRFCGRWYKSGNTLQAVIDLLKELPQRLAEWERVATEYNNKLAAEALTRKLDDPSIKVVYSHGKFVMTYVCDDLSSVAPVAEKLAADMAAASEAAWQEILSLPRPTSARFTAEGGFSLN